MDKVINGLRRSLKRHCEPWQRAVLENQLRKAVAERDDANAIAKAARDAERVATKARREAAKGAAKDNSLAVVSAKNIAPGADGRYRGRTIEGKRLLAHRVAVGLAVGDRQEAHHIDHDTENNSPMNLKKMSHQENCNLRRKRAGTSSMYIGVVWDKTRGKYRTRIKLKDGTTKHLGYFDSEEEGRDIYNDAAVREYGVGNKTLNDSERAGTVWDIIQAVTQDTEYLFSQVQETRAWLVLRTPALVSMLETGDASVIDSSRILSQGYDLREVTIQ